MTSSILRPRTVPIVLAAGASSRMGSPKALLDFDGATAIERLLDACRRAGCVEAIVVLGADADRIVERLSYRQGERNDGHTADGVRIVMNPVWRSGRTSSLKAGLRALDDGTEAFLIAPVDCPLVDPGTIERMLDVARRAGGATAAPGWIVIPSHGGRRGHPVLCAAALAREFLALGDDEPLKIVTHADPDRVRTVEVDDLAVLDNLDTPEEHERVLERWRSRLG